MEYEPETGGIAGPMAACLALILFVSAGAFWLMGDGQGGSQVRATIMLDEAVDVAPPAASPVAVPAVPTPRPS